MSKLEEAKNILNELKVPLKQQSDLCGYVILAMADIKKNDEWANATNKWIRIHDVIAFIREFYEVSYAENSRETFRKQAMHHFRNAAFIEDNGKATNLYGDADSVHRRRGPLRIHWRKAALHPRQRQKRFQRHHDLRGMRIRGHVPEALSGHRCSAEHRCRPSGLLRHGGEHHQIVPQVCAAHLESRHLQRQRCQHLQGNGGHRGQGAHHVRQNRRLRLLPHGYPPCLRSGNPLPADAPRRIAG